MQLVLDFSRITGTVSKAVAVWIIDFRWILRKLHITHCGTCWPGQLFSHSHPVSFPLRPCQCFPFFWGVLLGSVRMRGVLAVPTYPFTAALWTFALAAQIRKLLVAKTAFWHFAKFDGFCGCPLYINKQFGCLKWLRHIEFLRNGSNFHLLKALRGTIINLNRILKKALKVLYLS